MGLRLKCFDQSGKTVKNRKADTADEQQLDDFREALRFHDSKVAPLLYRLVTLVTTRKIIGVCLDRFVARHLPILTVSSNG